jgi:phenylalanyl-tRNA synthetase beta chain
MFCDSVSSIGYLTLKSTADMKLSLRWIFDHLQGSANSIDINDVSQWIGNRVAELEEITFINRSFDQCVYGQITAIGLTTDIWCSQLNRTVNLDNRPDGRIGYGALLIQEDNKFRWALLSDVGSVRTQMYPLFNYNSEDASRWKDQVVCQDWILTIDNKSITHRPDLWSHRGFAQELSGALNMPMRPLQELCAFLPAPHVNDTDASAGPISIYNTTSACQRFAAIYLSNVNNQLSNLYIIDRLLAIDSKPINALVDATNYVMYDMGQPLHAFDVRAFENKTLYITTSSQNQSLTLLDGTTVQTCADDIVITNGTSPQALAGIMGGQESSIKDSTAGCIVEAACFQGSVIRKTSARVKKRTDASARFEKNIDPTMQYNALARFISVLNDMRIAYTLDLRTVYLGKNPEVQQVFLSYKMLCERIGLTVKISTVESILQSLGFKVNIQDDVFTITVPPFRGTKESLIPEDIIEEIARIIRFDSIVPVLPQRPMSAFDISTVTRTRLIKQICAFGMHMNELQSYAMFDEQVLDTIKWEPKDAIEVLSPVSENWRRLCTTLVPHMLQAIHKNHMYSTKLAFFEFGRAWYVQDDRPYEHKKIAAIWYDKYKPVDFYWVQDELDALWDGLGISVKYQVASKTEPWYTDGQYAHIYHDEYYIGSIGTIDATWATRIFEGYSVAVELDGNYLINYKAPTAQFISPSRYPIVQRDISILVEKTISADSIIAALRAVDSRITSVYIIDRFYKPDMHTSHALTLRILLQDTHGTMIVEDIDSIMHKLTVILTESFNARIR